MKLKTVFLIFSVWYLVLGILIVAIPSTTRDLHPEATVELSYDPGPEKAEANCLYWGETIRHSFGRYPLDRRVTSRTHEIKLDYEKIPSFLSFLRTECPYVKNPLLLDSQGTLYIPE